jgi:hypothetical protein
MRRRKRKIRRRKKKKEKGKEGRKCDPYDPLSRKKDNMQGMLVHACNPRTWEVETGGLQIPGQSGLHNNIFVFQNKNKYIFT